MMTVNEILYDNRWIGDHGIGRFASEVSKRIPNMQHLPNGPSPLHVTDSFWLGHVISKFNPDIYLSPGFNPPLYSSSPFVFTIHDLILNHFPEETNILKKIFFLLVVKPAVKKALRVLTVSEFSRREIIKWADVPEDKVLSVGCGVSECFTRSGTVWMPGYKYFLYVGNHSPHKNLDRLIDAFADSGLWKQVKLVLTGSPSVELQKKIHNRDLSASIIFAGHIKEQALPSYYRGALALVLPSLYEGFGLPVVEAMACGTPVITSNVTSLPEISGEAALLVNPLDTEMIASALRRIFEDSELRNTMSEKGFKRARNFNWDDVVARIHEAINVVNYRRDEC